MVIIACRSYSDLGVGEQSICNLSSGHVMYLCFKFCWGLSYSNYHPVHLYSILQVHSGRDQLCFTLVKSFTTGTRILLTIYIYPAVVCRVVVCGVSNICSD